MEESSDEPSGEDALPERTCVGCRVHGARDDLIRLVAAPDGTVAVDLRGRLPGRGAWVHPRAACVERAVGGAKRRLRLVDPGEIPARVRLVVAQAAIEALGVATRAGVIVASGHDALSRAAEAGQVRAVVVATDASPRSVRDLHAEERGIPVFVLPLDRDGLGRVIGRGPRAAVGVGGGPAATPLLMQLRRLADLG